MRKAFALSTVLLVGVALTCACGSGGDYYIDNQTDDGGGTVDETAWDVPPPDTWDDPPVEALPEVAPEPEPEVEPDPPEEEAPPPPVYPPGPYGTGIGSTMANITMVASDGYNISMDDFFFDPAVELLLIFSTTGWCPTCAEESEVLPGYYSTYNARGLQILCAVSQDAYGNPANAADARAYANQYRFTFPTAADPSDLIGRYFIENTIPFTMLVDLTTMKVLYKTHNFGSSIDREIRNRINNYLTTIGKIP